MTGQTLSSVHDPSSMLRQRWEALAHDQCALCGAGIYSQIIIGLSLYVYDHVSTPGWMSVLLMLPYLLGMFLWARLLARRADAEKGVMASAMGEKAARVLGLLPAAAFLFDAALIFFSLCAVIENVLPDLSPRWISLSVALFTSAALIQKNEYALPRLARLLRWLIAVPLLYCAFTAIPHGNAAHFFPLLGYGAPTIGKGALWLWGCGAACVWPLVMPQDARSLSPLLEKPKILLFPLLRALLFGAVTMLVSVWLLPVYAMARPQTFGWRLLLVTHMTPSIAAWSLEVIGLMLLFLLALSGAVSQAALLIARAYGRSRAPSPLIFALLLMLVPLGAWPVPEIQRTLCDLAPWRAALAAALLLILTAGFLIRRPRKEPPK